MSLPPVHPPGDPGVARVAAIVAHWSVDPDVARGILAAAGLRPVSDLGPRKYRWREIWALEGDHYVPPARWAEWKAPLLIPSRLGDLDGDRSARTYRRHVRAGRIPGIHLSATIVRVRRAVFETALLTL